MKIVSEQNLADPFTKTLPEWVFTGHLEGLGLRDMSHLLYGKWEIVGHGALKACNLYCFMKTIFYI